MSLLNNDQTQSNSAQPTVAQDAGMPVVPPVVSEQPVAAVVPPVVAPAAPVEQPAVAPMGDQSVMPQAAEPMPAPTESAMPQNPVAPTQN